MKWRRFPLPILLLISIAPLAPAVAQDLPAHTPRYDGFEGCYELAFGSDARWVDDLEHRIRLTLVELSVPNASVPIFLVRPSPGAAASAYDRVSWTFSRGQLRLSWTAGIESVDGKELLPIVYFGTTVVFEPATGVPAQGLVGTARYSEHTGEDATRSTEVTVRPTTCLAVRLERPHPPPVLS